MGFLSNLWWQSFRHPSARNKSSKLLSYPADIKMRRGCAILKLLKLIRKAFVTISPHHITIIKARLNKAMINND